MKQIINRKIILSLSLVLLVTSCRKATNEFIEKTGLKEVGSEVIGNISLKEIKTGISKNLFKKTVRELSESGLSKETSNIISKEFSEDLILKLSKDIAEKPSFLKLINENPLFVSSYKKLQDFPQHRLNPSYLYQTKQWINKGSKGQLIIDIPKNINKKYKNSVLEGIQFTERTINYKEVSFKGVFPDFSKHSAFSTSLPEKYYTYNDNNTFDICKNALRKEYEKNPPKIEQILRDLNRGKVYKSNGVVLNEEEMLKKQIKDILQENSGQQKGRIFGFTWHHNEAVGRMDLVADDIHKKVKHVGGNSIWGGGSTCR
ncbi:HNH endonuclease [Flavobacterium sp. F-380]|uniref:HNH endonuclease n=1 Tax=Flavobacterium kayseriense TaxID=2764714 RepID=A0ABR7JAV9_9FLAO|nr:HNH endonuclease [Flavobacterium kayseriense]MBC5842641.1 HNH endonuclease [Flavobacterium kayseriense]MBC5849171.1 HNH endonuclease [Flavobacterium kayseriense]